MSAWSPPHIVHFYANVTNAKAVAGNVYYNEFEMSAVIKPKSSFSVPMLHRTAGGISVQKVTAQYAFDAHPEVTCRLQGTAPSPADVQNLNVHIYNSSCTYSFTNK